MTVSTEQFRDALKKVCMIKVNRLLPVLSYVELTAIKGKGSLTATDLEKTIEIEFDAKSDSEFSILLPRKAMQTFLYGNNGNLLIEANAEGVVSLSRGELGKMSFKPCATKDFPPTPSLADNTIWANVDAKWLCQMLAIAIPACAKEHSRPILTGVVFKDGAMASADGFRLVAIKSDKLALGLGDESVIIPAETLDLVRRLFSKEDIITIGFDLTQKQVYFKTDNTMVISQTIQGNFPAYENLIPQSFVCKASFSTPLMLQRLNMIDPSNIYGGIMRLLFQREEKHNEEICSITTKGTNNDCEEAYAMTLPVKLETREIGKIAVNHKYLCDALKPFSMTTLELTSLSSPLKLTGDIEGLTIVVMPMFAQ